MPALTPSELEAFPSLEWSDVGPRLTATLRSSLEKVLETQNGGDLSLEDSHALANSDGDDLLGLLVAADLLRSELAGNLVTYVVNRNINFTNVCFVGCKFCAFSRGPRESDAYFLTFDQVAQKAVEAWQLGATEVCIQGGLPHGLPKFYYRDILRAVKNAVPGMHIHAFSPMEIVYGVELTGMTLRDYLAMLRDNGLDTLPGTAAEILDDEVRAIICPDKLRTDEWLNVIGTAHEVGLRTTATIMFGHVEQPEHWARHLRRLRSLQERTHGITEFVPLGYVHMEAPLWRKGRTRSGPSFREAVLMHAVPRLVLHPLIRNIQTSWVKMGAEGAALCLDAGANDLGGTLMNESITRAAGGVHGQELNAAQLEALACRIGRPARQRTTLYGIPGEAPAAWAIRTPSAAEPALAMAD